MKIVEKRPDGRGSMKEVRKWISAVDTNMSDARPLYNALLPGIKQALRYTFSDANPNTWVPLGQKYKAWKAIQGYPTTIGILTGALKRSWVETPEIKMKKKLLNYTFDKSEAGYLGKPVPEYITKFNDKRPILPYVKRWLKDTVIATAIKSWLALNKTVEK